MFVLASVSNATYSVATIKEPGLTIKGVESHDIYDLSNIFYVKDADVVLPYEPNTAENISFAVTSIELAKQFENATTDSSLVTINAANDYYVDLLRDANGISYLLLKEYNKTVLSASTWYELALTNDLNLEVGNNYYIIFIAKAEMLKGTASAFLIRTRFDVVDEFGNSYSVEINLQTNREEIGYSASINKIYVYLNLTKSNAVQYKLQDLIDAVGISINVRKITKVTYSISYLTPATLSDSAYECAGMFYTAILTKTAFKINDILVNNTKTIGFKATDSISSTLEINKIADVSIPFEWMPEPEKSYDSDSLSVKYDYLFSLDSYSGEVSYSGVTANFTLNDFADSSKANITYFYVSGSDYSSELESNGYYSWSVSPDTQYYVSAKFKVSRNVFYSLVGVEEAPPLTWATFPDWLRYYFWYVVAIIASILAPVAGAGLYNKAQEEKAKAKASYKNKAR